MNRHAQEITPRAILFMIVGPHSGYSLAEIFEMKRKEENRLGVFYWGYAGTLCHPPRVQRFGAASMNAWLQPPTVVLAETASRYTSRTVGALRYYSKDGESYTQLPRDVVMIGCTVAVVCRKLQLLNATIDLNRYRVEEVRDAGKPLGSFIRFQINKACATLRTDIDRYPERRVRIVATAELAPPYSVYLKE